MTYQAAITAHVLSDFVAATVNMVSFSCSMLYTYKSPNTVFDILLIHFVVYCVLRCAARGALQVLACRTSTFGPHSFAACAPELWNSLPLSLRDPTLTLTSFCSRLWSENISVSFCLRAPRYGSTLWCSLGLLVGGAIQVPQLQLQLSVTVTCNWWMNLLRMWLHYRNTDRSSAVPSIVIHSVPDHTRCSVHGRHTTGVQGDESGWWNTALQCLQLIRLWRLHCHQHQRPTCRLPVWHRSRYDFRFCAIFCFIIMDLLSAVFRPEVVGSDRSWV